MIFLDFDDFGQILREFYTINLVYSRIVTRLMSAYPSKIFEIFNHKIFFNISFVAQITQGTTNPKQELYSSCDWFFFRAAKKCPRCRAARQTPREIQDFAKIRIFTLFKNDLDRESIILAPEISNVGNISQKQD